MVENIYPLSPLQEGLYFHWLSDPSSTLYFEQMNYRLNGQVDESALRKSYDLLVARHGVLRTFFTQKVGDQPLQVVKQEVKSNFCYRDVSQERDFSVSTFQESDRSKGFDLHKGSQMRLTVLALGDSTYEFVWSYHHILMDGWCIGILISEFFKIYNALMGGMSPSLVKPYPYSNYIEWLNRLDKNKGLQYWKEYLSGYQELCVLPKRNRLLKKPSVTDQLSFKIDPEIAVLMEKLCAQLSITENTFIQTAWGILLSKYNNTRDMVFGTVVSGRPGNLMGVEEMIGLFINTIPVRVTIDHGQKVIDLLRKVHADAIAGTAHHYTQLAHIQSQSELGKNIFDHITQFQNYPTQEILEKVIDSQDQLQMMSSDIIEQNNFDFTLVATRQGGITIKFLFNTNVYERAVMVRLQHHFQFMINQMANNPQLTIDCLECLDPFEKQKLLVDFNNTETAYPEDKTVVDLFLAQVEKTPNALAVTFEDTSLTYRALNEQSNRLANYLINNCHVKPNDLIGVMMDRSESVVIAMLGILKSGGAYVPIDVEYPQARKDFMISDSGIKTMITESAYIFDLDKFEGEVLALDIQLTEMSTTAECPEVLLSPEQLMYVIYTSGSTGRPKGVMVNHGSVVRLVKDTNYVTITDNDCLLSLSNFVFDGSTFDVYGALLNGARLVITGSQAFLNHEMLDQTIKKNGVTLFFVTTALFNAFAENSKLGFSTMRKIFFGGQRVSVRHVKQFQQQYPHIQLVHVYGPTENTTFSTFYNIDRVNDEDITIPIGSPLANSQCYILDASDHLSPIGAIGELCVGGVGLANGYLNNEQLTEQKFVANPFTKQERIYRTGDLARWLPDGIIEFVGRQDDQVKIRGHRIELGEIEHVLHEHSAITRASIVVQENPQGEKELIAYLVCERALNVQEIRQYLGVALPSYMIPSYYVQLEQFPLNANGKIDKRALPLPKELSMTMGSPYVAPIGKMEETMVKLWEKILDRKEVGVKDDFFDLGGDSIKVLRLTSEIRKSLDLDVPVADIYTHTTIRDLLTHITAHREGIDGESGMRNHREVAVRQELKKLNEEILSTFSREENVEEVYPMSDIEKGMMYESTLNMDLSVYHDQIVHRHSFVNFNIEIFTKALQLLVHKHSILRTRFDLDSYAFPMHIVYEEVTIPVTFEDLSAMSREVQEGHIQGYLNEELKKPFKAGDLPMWRMKVFHLGNDDLVFVFQFHHAILDGWSDSLFITELNNVYLQLCDNTTFCPEPLKATYKDYIIQDKIAGSDPRLKEFWKQELQDFDRLELFTGESLSQRFSIGWDDNEVHQLEQMAIQLKTSVKVISLSAYLIMLKWLANSGVILTGLVTHNRPTCEDGDKILGCFLNTIPFRIDVVNCEKGTDLIQQVHDKLVQLKSKEGLSAFEISRLHRESALASNPFSDVFFNYVDFHSYDHIIESSAPEDRSQLSEALHLQGKNITNFNLDFAIDRTGGQFLISLHLTKKLKCGFSSQKLALLYQRILRNLISSPDLVLNQQNWLDEKELQKLLIAFNSTQVYYSDEKTVVDLFEEQVERTPDRIAFVFDKERLSYQALNEKCNQFARYLRESGVQRGAYVGVLINRSAWSVISMLSIHKLGCIYVPIDNTLPDQRIFHILQENHLDAVITDNCIGISERSLSSPVNEISIDAFKEVSDVSNIGLKIERSEPSFIIYTSGSTGQPKGIEQTHLTLYNLVQWDIQGAKLKQGAIFLQFSSFGFDSSLHDVYYTLATGGELHVVNDALRENFSALRNYILEQGISILSMPYAALKVFFDTTLGEGFEGHLLEEIISTGEQLYVTGPLRHFLKKNPNVRIHNFYGPSETHVVTGVSHSFGDGLIPEKVSLGSPIFNTHIYVLNQEMQILPIGVEGDIYVGGSNLAIGYYGQADITAASFVQDPFSPGDRLYRTGDIGKWKMDGSIEFMGRTDEQVKIRGYRIELGEIEWVMQKIATIDGVVVLPKVDQVGQQELWAYVESKESLHKETIINHLKEVLPNYMIPSHFIRVDQFPLTSNGKVDKQALSHLDDTELAGERDYVAPRDAVEKKLAEIWEDLLGISQVSVYDDFLERGGHSLNAVRLISRINKEFGLKFDLRGIYKETTIELMAQKIRVDTWFKESPVEDDGQYNEIRI